MMADSTRASLELVYTKRAKKKSRTYGVPEPLAPIADTHAHLTCFWETDPAWALARAAAAGDRMLVTLFDPIGDDYTAESFSRALDTWISGARAHLVTTRPSELAILLDQVFFLVGVHPYGAPGYTDEVHAQLIQALRDPRCRGIGEIGLDYHFDADDNIEAAPHDVQIACMARQLELACERGLPVELHLRNDIGDASREAHADAFRVLCGVGMPSSGCVLHCFTEDRPTMERFCELGCYIAFGGAATFKRNEGVREAFAACPLDRILFETDCPYMAPEPIRGLECEPAMIPLTIEALCYDRASRTGEDPAAIARAAWDNARRLFAR